MSGTLGGDHDNIYILRRLDASEMDIEAVCERKGLALGKIGLDGLIVESGLLLIVDKDHDDVGSLCSLRARHNAQPLSLCLCPALGALIEAYNNINSAVLQV